MLYSSGQAATLRALSRLHIQLFFLIKKFQGSGIGENDVRETVGRRNNRKLNLFSMHFVRNNEEIHLPFKNSEK